VERGRRPIGEGQIPGKIEQRRPVGSQAKPRDPGRIGLAGQSFLRRYAATDAS
jgi:hypothetical protein